MNILSTQYTLATRSLEIYIAGCKGNNGVHCTGCHNPESWSFDQGTEYGCMYFIKNIKEKVERNTHLVDNIMIFGGEPLDQPINKLVELVQDLNYLKKPIWLFTRYDLEAVPIGLKRYCSYIKTGNYDPSKIVDDNIQYGIKLATSNQHIYKRGIDY